MRKSAAVLAGIAASFVTMAALAHGEKGAPPAEGWSGSVAGGYVAVRGNSDSTTANFKTEVLYDDKRWHHSALATAVGASQDGDTSAEAYKGLLKTKYDMSETIYAFGLAEYNKDRFSAYDYQVFEVAGLGWRVFRSDSQELNLEAGVGAKQSKLRQPDPPEPLLAPGERNVDEFVGRLGAEYHWHISESAVFSEKVASTMGSDNTYIESLTELKTTVVGALSLALGYLVKHNTDVPGGVDKTDSQTSISLEYAF